MKFSLVTSERTQEIMKEKKVLSNKKYASSKFLVNMKDKKQELKRMLQELEMKEREFQSPVREEKKERKSQNVVSKKEVGKERKNSLFAKHILIDQVYEDIEESKEEEFNLSLSFSESKEDSEGDQNSNDYPEEDGSEEDGSEEDDYDDDEEDAI